MDNKLEKYVLKGAVSELCPEEQAEIAKVVDAIKAAVLPGIESGVGQFGLALAICELRDEGLETL